LQAFLHKFMENRFSKSSKAFSVFLIFFLISQLSVGLFYPSTKQAKADGESWYSSSWLYRKPITVDNTSGTSTLTNYQVQVTLNSSNFDFSKAQINGEDLRFTDSDGLTPIKYYITNYDSINQIATIWPQVPSVATSSTATIYMYYGNLSSADPNTAYTKISVDSTIHSDYGLSYPLTYEFSIPEGSSGLKAYRRYNINQTWAQITEKTSNDFFNGIEAVRYDYSDNKVYVSVAFSSSSDEIHLKITNSLGYLVEVASLGITTYYDNRDAVVTVSGDDWFHDAPPGTVDANSANDTAFKIACDALTSKGIWFSAGIVTDTHYNYGWIHPDWDDVQVKIDAGYIEIASHSATHNVVPYPDYDAEISGSKNDLISNLDLDYKNGTQEYVYAFLEPYASHDATSYTKIGQAKYIVERSSTVDRDSFATWNATYDHYITGGSLWLESSNLNDANAKFDTVIGANGIYHIMMHPRLIDWAVDSWQLQHIDYIKEKKNLWYSGLGHLYLYHYLDDQNKITISKMGGGDNDIVVMNDDFIGSTLDTNSWTESIIGGDGSVVINNGVVILEPQHNVVNNVGIKSNTNGFSNLRSKLLLDFTTSAYLALSLGSGDVVDLSGSSQKTFKNGYALRISSNTDAKLIRMVNGVYTQLAAYTTALGLTSYHIYEIVVDSLGVHVERDGVQILTSADSTYSDGYGLFACGKDATKGSTSTIDWVKLSTQNSALVEPLTSLDLEQGYPIAPTIGAPIVVSSNTIRWNFTDNSGYETGFKLYDSNGTLIKTVSTPNLSYIDETGISASAIYTRYIKAYNSYGDSSASSDATQSLGSPAVIINTPVSNQQQTQTTEQGVNLPTVTFDKPISQMTKEEILAKIAEITQTINQIKSLMPSSQSNINIPSSFSFISNLKKGISNLAVEYLQMILNQNKDTQLAETGIGSPGNETTYFGSLTEKAVTKFQEKYRDSVLSPWGFTNGTGYVGKTTREKLNELIK